MKSHPCESAAQETAPVVLRPAPRPYACILGTASLGLIAAGLLLASHPGWVTGWILLAVAAIAATSATAMLLPGAHGLILEPGGFTIRYFWRDLHVAWSEVERFGVDRRGLPAFAWIEGHPAHRDPAASLRRAPLPGALPDTFGHSARHLVEELERWRRGAADDD